MRTVVKFVAISLFTLTLQAQASQQDELELAGASRTCGPTCTIVQRQSQYGSTMRCIKMDRHVSECYRRFRDAVKTLKQMKEDGLCN